MAAKSYVIALEEHYAWDPVSADNVVGNWLRDNDVDTYRRLYDRGENRLQQMDAAGHRLPDPLAV